MAASYDAHPTDITSCLAGADASSATDLNFIKLKNRNKYCIYSQGVESSDRYDTQYSRIVNLQANRFDCCPARLHLLDTHRTQIDAVAFTEYRIVYGVLAYKPLKDAIRSTHPKITSIIIMIAGPQRAQLTTGTQRAYAQRQKKNTKDSNKKIQFMYVTFFMQWKTGLALKRFGSAWRHRFRSEMISSDICCSMQELFFPFAENCVQVFCNLFSTSVYFHFNRNPKKVHRTVVQAIAMKIYAKNCCKTFTC